MIGALLNPGCVIFNHQMWHPPLPEYIRVDYDTLEMSVENSVETQQSMANRTKCRGGSPEGMRAGVDTGVDMGAGVGVGEGAGLANEWGFKRSVGWLEQELPRCLPPRFAPVS